MVLRVATVLILLLSSFCASAIAQAKPVSQIVITIKRETGLDCARDYSAEIYADGTVIYRGQACAKVIGERRHTISTDRVAELIKAFEQANYFSFKDSYEYDEHGMTITDLTRTTTSISLNGKTKKVVDYLSPPKELVALEQLIEKLAGLYEYIGPL